MTNVTHTNIVNGLTPDRGADHLLSFIKNSPSPWHACNEMRRILTQAGALELDERQPWQLEAGKLYFVARDQASLIAFRLPEKRPIRAIIHAAHTDSPGLKVKPQGEFEQEGLHLVSFEVYGSPIIASWLGRDLALTGRVFTENAGVVRSQLVYFDAHPVMIPHCAIHLDRGVNEEGLLVNKQTHLAAVASCGHYLQRILPPECIHHELFAVPLEEGRFLGFDNTLIAAPRLDNLASCAAILEALLKSDGSAETLQMAVCWNHEEVGSTSRVGAASTFFPDTLERICTLLGLNREAYFCLKAKSLTLSIDVAHGAHPNYSEKYEPRHKPILGQGVCVKLSAQERYASSGEAVAKSKSLFKAKGIPLQTYLCRSDMPCGSTIGPIHASNTGIATVDLGIPLLAMHASRELIHIADFQSLVYALKIVFSC